MVKESSDSIRQIINAYNAYIYNLAIFFVYRKVLDLVGGIVVKRKGVFDKFLLVSVGALSIDFLIYIILVNFIDVIFSKFISVSVSCIFSYFANKAFTFNIKEKSTKRGVIYVLTQIINISSNTLTNTVILEILRNKIIAFCIATIVGTIVNYVLQKFIVFKKK